MVYNVVHGSLTAIQYAHDVIQGATHDKSCLAKVHAIYELSSSCFCKTYRELYILKGTGNG
jgi:hypothetical protein